MALPPNFSKYMNKLIDAMMRDLSPQTVHTWGRYVIMVLHSDNGDTHVWLLRDDFDSVAITYMPPEPTTFATDEDPTAVVGMIKAAME